MKQLKIEVPTGYEIDQEKSNFAEGVVKFKPVVKENRVPKSIDDVKGRDWYINSHGVIDFVSLSPTPNHFSTAERAEAMLALGQLREIHAAVEQNKNALYCPLAIESADRNVRILFWFETKELKEEFESLHKQLIETVEKGL